MDISRRAALLGTVAGGLGACATSFDRRSFTAISGQTDAVFAHGIASGDPARESVVLWTRISGQNGSLPVTAEISDSRDFTTLIKTYRTETSGARDYTVKVIADQLTPGQTYFYRFRAGTATSTIGRTKTLPEKTQSARFAVTSCSNYPFGYFNAYDHMARQDDLDAVIHLGDYIYEYGTDGYGGPDGKALGRDHSPAHEILTLKDYRQRHGQYKSDPAAQAMHALHSIIAIWDDHETANDSWSGGAQNHDSTKEGTWNARRRAAMQAYYEWMPVREPTPGRAREDLYKEYNWGGLLTLASIETRLTARSKQIQYEEVMPTLKSAEDIETFRREVLNDPKRALLSAAQFSYLEAAIGNSVKRQEPWRMIANQVIMARVKAPRLGDYVTEEQVIEIEKEWSGVRAFIQFSQLGLPLNMDAWDGYPAAREQFFQTMQQVGARDLIVLTGDTHEAWANDLHDDQGTRMGIELATTAVSSPGSAKYLGSSAADYSLLMRKENRDVRFHDPMSRGYILLTLNEDKGRADYISLNTVTSQTYEAAITARFALVQKNGTIEFSAPKGLGFKERVLY